MATREPVDAASAPDPRPAPAADADYHCPNCAYLNDPTRPGEGFWACQNLCVR